MHSTLCWLAIVLATQVPAPIDALSEGSSLRKERDAIGAKESSLIKALAQRLTVAGDAAAARDVLGKLEPETTANGPTRFVPLPRLVAAGAPQGMANVPARQAERQAWRGELRSIRETTARSLFVLAGKAVEGSTKHYALADACLRGVIARMPDHPEARRLLGFVPYEGGWATPHTVRMIREGKVDHPTFGWVPREWVPHLEKDELPAPPARGQRSPRWLPANEADELHADWDRAWKIDTEHFQVKTNVPLSEAIAFGRQLEAFHELFFSLLADMLSLDNRLPLAQRFRDKKMQGERTQAPHQVYYFKNKQEYVDFLVPVEPRIAGSLGIYIPPASRQGKRAPAYFFRDPGGQIETEATLFHEVSHQLLFESAGPNAYERNVGNFWVFEGMGTYFETVEIEPDGSLKVGGLVGPRIAVARQRIVNQHELVPIEHLVQLGEGGFKNEETVHLLYAESMALAVFLMQADHGAYRDAFLDYFKSAYRGQLKRGTGKSLQERLGVPYTTLDQQFLKFLERG